MGIPGFIYTIVNRTRKIFAKKWASGR